MAGLQSAFASLVHSLRLHPYSSAVRSLMPPGSALVELITEERLQLVLLLTVNCFQVYMVLFS